LKECGQSYREIGGIFGVSHTTIRSYHVYGSSTEFNRTVAQNNGCESVREYQYNKLPAELQIEVIRKIRERKGLAENQ
jgi:hypothetical protein